MDTQKSLCGPRLGITNLERHAYGSSEIIYQSIQNKAERFSIDKLKAEVVKNRSQYSN